MGYYSPFGEKGVRKDGRKRGGTRKRRELHGSLSNRQGSQENPKSNGNMIQKNNNHACGVWAKQKGKELKQRAGEIRKRSKKVAGRRMLNCRVYFVGINARGD